MLSLDHVSAGYGDILAVDDISFEVPRGKTFALLGANGAGKTTTIRTIAGQVMPKSGTVTFKGEDLAGTGASKRAALGIALSPEGRRLFPDLTVAENLVVGGYCRDRSRQAANAERVTGYFPRLAERYRQRAGSLSGGEQQMLAIGRALMAEPELLLVDELSLGLMPKVIDDCYRVIDALKRDGLTILLVEQNTERALSVADHVAVLESGRLAWSGTAEDAAQNQDLVATLLGLSAA